MQTRVSPAFVVAVIALVVASGGTGYAAAKITSKQIKDGTIQSKDVKDGALTGVDLADGSVSSADLLDATITGLDVAAGSLTGAHLADGSVSGADLGDGSVTGADLGDGSVTGVDLGDGSVTGTDVANGSIGRGKLDTRCAGSEERLFGGCVRRVATGPTSQQAAVDDCSRRNGRLPTIGEARWIATHDEFTWANGNDSQYEFTGDWTTTYPHTPIGIDAYANSVSNASAQLFWHHCVTY